MKSLAARLATFATVTWFVSRKCTMLPPVAVRVDGELADGGVAQRRHVDPVLALLEIEDRVLAAVGEEREHVIAAGRGRVAGCGVAEQARRCRSRSPAGRARPMCRRSSVDLLRRSGSRLSPSLAVRRSSPPQTRGRHGTKGIADDDVSAQPVVAADRGPGHPKRVTGEEAVPGQDVVAAARVVGYIVEAGAAVEYRRHRSARRSRRRRSPPSRPRRHRLC